MNTAGNSAAFDAFCRTYSPALISRYVSTMLPRMYTGSAPTMAQVAAQYGRPNFRIWVSSMVEAILRFSGLIDRFDISQMDVLADMVLTRYPALKVTELMHFVFLCQCGDYEGFYGNPNGRTLLAQLARYVKADRERILADLRRGAEAASIVGAERPRAELSAEESEVVSRVLAEISSDEYQQKNGAWRYEPWGTEMCKAYFVHRTLADFPGDMTASQRRRWARANGFA